MSFEDYFNDFENRRGFLEDPRDKISISKKDYEKLVEHAEQVENLTNEIKKIKTENQKLNQELIDMKEDGRKYKELREESEKYLNSLLRVKADFENYKKINERENEKSRLCVAEKILSKLIKHLEDLKRALKVLESLENEEHVKKGFEMIIKNFEKLLSEEGVEPMNCEGEIFDPYKHEAILVENREDLPEGTIIEELDKGYYLNKKILRPARVKISKHLNNEVNQENVIEIKN